MRRETVKRITYMVIGLLIIVIASGCIGEKTQQDKAPAKTPTTPKATETPAQQPEQTGALKENEITSGENDLAQLESMINDMNMGDPTTIEVIDLAFQ